VVWVCFVCGVVFLWVGVGGVLVEGFVWWFVHSFFFWFLVWGGVVGWSFEGGV